MDTIAQASRAFIAMLKTGGLQPFEGNDQEGPLAVLANKLRVAAGPPRLSDLISRFSGVADFGQFLALVREFLPEQEAEIMARDAPGGQTSAFQKLFSERYFPIQEWEEWGDVCGYADMLTRIEPVIEGLTYGDVHEIHNDWKPAAWLPALFIALLDESLGLGTVWMEAAREHISEEVLARVPQVPNARLHQLVDNTPYQGLADCVDIICSDTGTYFFDVNPETYGYCDSGWSRQEVDAMTEQYRGSREILRRHNDFMDWLDEDLATRFTEVVDFVRMRDEVVPKDAEGVPPPRPLIDIFPVEEDDIAEEDEDAQS